MPPPPLTLDFWQKYNVCSSEDPFLIATKDLFVGHKKGVPTPAKLKQFWDTALELGKRSALSEQEKADAQKTEAARQESFEDGRKVGFREGRQAGLSEGKSLGVAEAKMKSTSYSEGYSAGWKAASERGEERGVEKERKKWVTAGHSETCRSENSVARVTVATSTDPPPSPNFHSVSTQTDLIPVPDDDNESATDCESIPDAEPPSFDWAKDAESIPIRTSNLPRDLTALRTKGAPKPFSSLQRRVRHMRSTKIPHERPCNSQDIYLRTHQQTSPSTAKSNPPSIEPQRKTNSEMSWRTSQSMLDWVRDPQLSRLAQALQELGWFLPHRF